MNQEMNTQMIQSDRAWWLLIPLGVVAGSLHAASMLPAKPNILLMVGDDIGWGDIGCYGSTQIKTPNIDRMAQEGTRFTSGYVTAALCSPSRAALLTGRYQQRNSLENNRLAETKNMGLDLSLKTLADVLGGAGYATGLVGKWHQGVGENKEYTPLRRGFQEFFGFYGYETSYTPATLIRGEEPVRETRRSTVAFAEEACAFIDRHSDKPFFLEVAFSAAHTPLEGARKDIVTAKFADITDPNFTDSPVNDAKRRNFCALVTELDEEIGRIMAKLEEKGLDEKTLVIYMSDNGGWISQGGNNGPLRGGKWGIYEGGQRVPFIWRWPGTLPAGKEYAAPVSSLDFMPTFAAMAGTSPPKDIDGLNLLPFLRGEQQGAPHGDLFWKLNDQCAIVRDQWKAVRFKGKPNNPELYELGKDPGEQTNVAGDKPEMLNQLNQAWDAWNAKLPPAFVPPKPAPPKPQPAKPNANPQRNK
jgi:arylsulfatase A-like enzyme